MHRNYLMFNSLHLQLRKCYIQMAIQSWIACALKGTLVCMLNDFIYDSTDHSEVMPVKMKETEYFYALGMK